MKRRSGTRFALRALVVAAVATAALLTPAACLAAGGRMAPADAAFLRYLEHAGRTNASRLGLAPNPVDLGAVPRGHLAPIAARFPASYASQMSGLDGAAAEETPSSFDLRLTSRLSAIRDQGRYGTCWAFAALASLESNMLPGTANDFSENNLAQKSGFSLGYDGGGNSAMAAAYLLRWDGPVAETADPYVPYGTAKASPSHATVSTHVREVLQIPGRTDASDNADLKWAVMTYGAVYTTMHWTSAAYRDTTVAYCSTEYGANHAVDVVGWDDGFPAERFASRPAGPGAYLVRNSWGDGFGTGGYFWVSYYDAAFGRHSAVFVGGEPANTTQRVYQHDPLGWVASYRPPAAPDPFTAWFAASYTPAEDGTLTAAGFYATAPDAAYEVRVADSVEAVRDAPVAASGTFALAGYHTVTLDAPVALTAGRPLVIAVRVTTPHFAFPIAVERPFAGYSTATSAPGQSYVSGDGEAWQDLTSLVVDADVCLKGYGSSASAPALDPDPAKPEERPALSVTGRAGTAGSLVRVAFRVEHPGSDGSADVRFTLRARRGGIVLRRTLRSMGVASGHVWRLRAPSRRGAYVVTAIATLGTGEVSQPASAVLRIH